MTRSKGTNCAALSGIILLIWGAAAMLGEAAPLQPGWTEPATTVAEAATIAIGAGGPPAPEGTAGRTGEQAAAEETPTGETGERAATEGVDHSGPAEEEPAVAEEESEEEIEEVEPVETPDEFSWNSPDRPRVDRVVHVMTARTTRQKTLLFTIDHLAWKSFTDEWLDDFFGFDPGAMKIGIGLRYGILDNFDVGLLRLNGTLDKYDTDTYDFDLKYQALRQDRHFLDLALRGGMTWFAVKEGDDSQGAFGQLLLNRTLGGRLRAGTGLLYHSDSWNEDKKRTDDDWSAAVPVTLEVLITPGLAWNAEMAANVGGFGLDTPVVSTSLKMMTHRHSFALVFSNNQYFGTDGIVTNTNRKWEDLIFGFTITRELPF